MRALMLRSIVHAYLLISVLAGAGLSLGAAVQPASASQQPKDSDAWQGWPGPDGWPKLPGPEWLDSTLNESAKKLETVKAIKQPGADIQSLQSKASDLLEKSKQARDNFFRCARLMSAANALMDAAYGIFQSRKADRAPFDFWSVGMVLQGYYYRIQQAHSFAQMSGEKNSDQYETLARTLYQQARGAYDAREYQRSRYLADAAASIVFALESIAQASAPPPTHPNFK